jgi:hypothetical protein
MFVTESEHKSAGKFAWFAAKDASMKSAVNASRFTPEQKLKAERVKLVLELMYSSAAEEPMITFCKTWIRVKVFTKVVKERKELRLIEEAWELENIKKYPTPQGIIYRVRFDNKSEQ